MVAFVGGKGYVAPKIATAIEADLRSLGIEPEGRSWFEPCCGGLGMSTRLARLFGTRGVVGDKHPALIALYRAVEDGSFDPPAEATEADWYASLTLPDSDPRKAFFGYGCSFSSMWQQRPNVERKRRWHRTQNYWCDDNPVGAPRRAPLRDRALLQGVTWTTCDLETGGLPDDPEVVYIDWPYEGTLGYPAVGAFNHDRGYEVLRAWARGRVVYLSEYVCRIPHVEIWSQAKGSGLAHKGSGLDKRATRVDATRVERLFRILPARS